MAKRSGSFGVPQGKWDECPPVAFLQHRDPHVLTWLSSALSSCGRFLRVRLQPCGSRQPREAFSLLSFIDLRCQSSAACSGLQATPSRFRLAKSPPVAVHVTGLPRFSSGLSFRLFTADPLATSRFPWFVCVSLIHSAFDSPRPVNRTTSSGLDATPDTFWLHQRLLVSSAQAPGFTLVVVTGFPRRSPARFPPAALTLRLPQRYQACDTFHRRRPVACSGQHATPDTFWLRQSLLVISPGPAPALGVLRRFPRDDSRFPLPGFSAPFAGCVTVSFRCHPSLTQVCQLPLHLRLCRAA